MTLQKLKPDFTVCKIADVAHVGFTREFVFLGKTDEEISLVCETSHVPANATEAESGWRALRVSGVLDFGLIGIIAKISNILAQAGISVFVVSTYNTDYILLKNESFDEGITALVEGGYTIE